MDAKRSEKLKHDTRLPIDDCLESNASLQKTLEEIKASIEKPLMEAKTLLQNIEYLALQIKDVELSAECLAMQIRVAEESKNLYVSDSDIEDDVHSSSTPTIRRGAVNVKVEEKPIINYQVEKDGNEMLKILLPMLFEKK